MPLSPRARRLSGLYLILDESWADQCSLVSALDDAHAAGCRLVQYRFKDMEMGEVYRRASALREEAGKRGMCFLVNDRCDIAHAVQADGVHVGQHDLPPSAARALLGDDAIIGLSTHNTEEVALANAASVDYIGFGPIFPTATKAHHEPVVGIEGLRAIRAMTDLPIIAIGGIHPAHVADLRAAGADGVAAISAILGAQDRREAAHAFISQFQ